MMELELKEKFLVLWKRYFGNEELPITFYYTTGDGVVKTEPLDHMWPVR